MGAFRGPLILTAIALFGGTLATWLLRRNYKPHAANLWLAAAAFGFLLAAHLGLQIFSPVLTSKQLADAIAPDLKPDDIIVIHGEYEAGSTLGFYLQRNDIHILEGRSSNLWYGSFFPDAPTHLRGRRLAPPQVDRHRPRLSLAGRQPAAAKASRQDLLPAAERRQRDPQQPAEPLLILSMRIASIE